MRNEPPPDRGEYRDIKNGDYMEPSIGTGPGLPHKGGLASR